mgnify:CR=1 FL=1
MRFANRYGWYELNPFPGCNQIAVSNHAFIYPRYRGLGHGKQQHLERLQNAKDQGYNYIICTVNSANSEELAILNKNGWQQLDSFVNIETTNNIQIFGKSLELY